MTAAAAAAIEQVIQKAREQLGKPYLIGTEGPDSFDCSGLIWFIFRENGMGELIGGGRHRAHWYQRWFEGNGWFFTDLSEAKRGDLVFYGHENVTHIGIYLGPKRRMTISALINPYGVTRHKVNRITVPIYGFGRVQY